MTTLETLLNDPDTAGVWNLVPDRSAFTFSTRTMWGLWNVKGRFNEVSGDAQITGKGAVFGRIDIQVASLRTGIRKRDEHLRSADFFDVERFPEISVVVTGVEPGPGNAAELAARVAIKDATHELPLPVTVVTLDDGSVRVSTSTKVERARFGLDWNKFGVVGKTTTVAAEAVFERAP
ncbi:YceI family protein [Mycobacterium sp. pUA109]|uniref:YceI family protein n=1 Tax=Mycobacterium sp. pUA109 TaxID=3238982 RepID=UPI00351B2E0D